MKLITILLVVLLFVLTACSSPPQGLAVAKVEGNALPTSEVVIDDSVMKEATDQSYFEFEGYTIGKSHVGTFDVWSATVFLEDGRIVAVQGVLDPESVNTGLEEVDERLRSDDFFDVERYPAITIQTTNMKDNMVTADVSFRGVTKSVTFPANITDTSISANFLLDTTDFAMKYTGVKKEVRIEFAIVA